MNNTELIEKLKAMISKPTDEFDRGYNAAIKRVIKMVEAEQAEQPLIHCKKCGALIETTVHCDNCGTFEPC